MDEAKKLSQKNAECWQVLSLNPVQNLVAQNRKSKVTFRLLVQVED